MPPPVDARPLLEVGDVDVAVMDGGEPNTRITLSPGGADMRLSLMAELDDNEGIEDRLAVPGAATLGVLRADESVVGALEFMIDRY